MYLQHFGLQRQPFKITPDTSMFYTGNKRGAALEALKYAIFSGEGIIKVVGEVGSGKTMLCRMLELELSNIVDVVYIANPSLSPENILHVIAFELKLDITPESSKLEVMQALQKYLLDKHAQNKQVVVFVEEAQSMPIETLEEIRLLSNLETSDYKLLQMVLFGQPELDEKLRNPSIRQLKERITHNFYLDPFPACDVFKYLNFRMRAVGYRGPDLFSEKVANNIGRKSNGLTRRINILADKALLAAFSEGGHNINTKHIQLAAQDSDFGQEQPWSSLIKIASAITIVLLSLWIGSLLPGFFSEDKSLPAEQALHKQSAINHPTDITPIKPLAGSRHNVPAPPEPIALPGTGLAQASSIQAGVNTLSLQERIAYSKQWLNQADDYHYTIHLLSSETWAEHRLAQFIEQAGQTLDSRYLYVYKAQISGRMAYSVLYNEYKQQNMAIKQLRQLSPWLRENGPFLRPIKGIKADILQTQMYTGEAGH